MKRRIAACLGALAVIACPALASGSDRPPVTARAAGGDKVFNVLQFGAVNDGSRDDQQAIRAALAAAAAWTDSGPMRKATVLFPCGVYNLTRVMGVYAIDVAGMHDISLQGQACDTAHPSLCSVLIGAPASFRDGSSNPAYNSFIDIENSRNISVSDFHMDKAVPYFAQGTVTAVDAGARTVDVSAEPGYLALEDPIVVHLLNIITFFPGRADVTWDHGDDACRPAGAAQAADQSCSNFHIVSRTQVAAGRWRFGLDKPPVPRFGHGRFLLWKNLGWQYGILVNHAENVSISNVFYTGGGGPAVHVQGSSGRLSVSGLTVDVPAGSDRLFAATSGLNATRNRGTIMIRDAHVRSVDDDAFHVSGGTYNPVIAQGDGGLSATVALCYDGDFRPGDRVAVWNWRTKTQTDSAVVTSVRVAATAPHQRFVRVCELGLDKAVKPMSGVATYDPAMLGRATDDNDRISNVSGVATLVVQDSVFSSMRAHCGIIQVSTAFLRNRCENTPFAGLLIGPEYQWGEGFAVHGVQVVGNSFDNIGGTAIRVGDVTDSNRSRGRVALAAGDQADPVIDNSDITITGNSFSRLGLFERGLQGIRGLAVSVENASGVTIRDNRFPAGSVGNVVVAAASTRDVRQ